MIGYLVGLAIGMFVPNIFEKLEPKGIWPDILKSQIKDMRKFAKKVYRTTFSHVISYTI